jgi:hypothetical protein
VLMSRDLPDQRGGFRNAGADAVRAQRRATLLACLSRTRPLTRPPRCLYARALDPLLRPRCACPAGGGRGDEDDSVECATRARPRGSHGRGRSFGRAARGRK